MKYDYLITATGDNDRDGAIQALLMKYAKLDNVKIQSHMSFHSFLETLPETVIPGISNASRE